jgi:hypothetical protein
VHRFWAGRHPFADTSILRLTFAATPSLFNFQDGEVKDLVTSRAYGSMPTDPVSEREMLQSFFSKLRPDRNGDLCAATLLAFCQSLSMGEPQAEMTIEHAHRLLEFVPRALDPAQWAETHHYLAAFYTDLDSDEHGIVGTGASPNHCEAAWKHATLALEVHTAERNPDMWAKSHYKLSASIINRPPPPDAPPGDRLGIVVEDSTKGIELARKGVRVLQQQGDTEGCAEGYMLMANGYMNRFMNKLPRRRSADLQLAVLNWERAMDLFGDNTHMKARVAPALAQARLVLSSIDQPVEPCFVGSAFCYQFALQALFPRESHPPEHVFLEEMLASTLLQWSMKLDCATTSGLLTEAVKRYESVLANATLETDDLVIMHLRMAVAYAMQQRPREGMAAMEAANALVPLASIGCGPLYDRYRALILSAPTPGTASVSALFHLVP